MTKFSIAPTFDPEEVLHDAQVLMIMMSTMLMSIDHDHDDSDGDDFLLLLSSVSRTALIAKIRQR